MPCRFIIQVQPPGCEYMRAESKPAEYAHFAVLSRARLREQGISFRDPHGDLFLPAAGEVAEGFWVDEQMGCLRVGEGRVVKVYEKCDVRVVDPMRGVAGDWGGEGEDKCCDEGEDEGKDKDKGEKQREEAQDERKTVRFQLPPAARVFDEKEKVRSTVVDTGDAGVECTDDSSWD
ncbi:hypothetical protein BJY01DRAFT_244881 [Aspergillus pseudoustus]|uniref:Uncharacterized protein n=1 Tax=Aspergillus pseudoustus TaxID=1810923 RepID=A0ABR4KH42_9EURO